MSFYEIDPEDGEDHFEEVTTDVIVDISQLPYVSPSREEESCAEMCDISSRELAELWFRGPATPPRPQVTQPVEYVPLIREDAALFDWNYQRSLGYTVEDMEFWFTGQSEIPPSYLPGPPTYPSPPFYSPPCVCCPPPASFGVVAPPQPVNIQNQGEVYWVTEDDAPPQLGSAETLNQEQNVLYCSPTYTFSKPRAVSLSPAAPPNSNLLSCSPTYTFSNPRAVPLSPPAAPPKTFVNTPAVDGQKYGNLKCVPGRVLKRKLDDGNQPCENEPCEKKPRSAFMMYVEHHRSAVAAEISIQESSVVDRLLGQTWRELSAEQQAKYYELAQQDSDLQTQNHPDWTGTNNYGKKRKRDEAERKSAGDY